MSLSRRRNLFSVTDLMKENKGEGGRPHREGERRVSRSHMEEVDGGGRESRCMTEPDEG